MTPTAAKALLEKENDLLGKFIETISQFDLGGGEEESSPDGARSMRNSGSWGDNEFRKRIRTSGRS
jgi:hypothetical protein